MSGYGGGADLVLRPAPLRHKARQRAGHLPSLRVLPQPPTCVLCLDLPAAGAGHPLEVWLRERTWGAALTWSCAPPRCA